MSRMKEQGARGEAGEAGGVGNMGDMRDNARLHALQAEVMRLRGALIVQTSLVAILREDHAVLEAQWRGAERGSDADGHAVSEATLAAADMVICQVACISHDDYWRVEDHCKRTGKQCVLVQERATDEPSGHR